MGEIAVIVTGCARAETFNSLMFYWRSRLLLSAKWQNQKVDLGYYRPCYLYMCICTNSNLNSSTYKFLCCIQYFNVFYHATADLPHGVRSRDSRCHGIRCRCGMCRHVRPVTNTEHDLYVTLLHFFFVTWLLDEVYQVTSSFWISILAIRRTIDHTYYRFRSTIN